MAKAKKPVKKYEDGGPMTTTSETTKKPKDFIGKVKKGLSRLTMKDVKDSAEDALNLSTLGGYGVAKKKIKKLTGLKSGGTVKKAKSGAKFDLNKDGKTTFKDVLIGRGVLPKKAKSGAKMKKAQIGSKFGDMGKSTSSMPSIPTGNNAGSSQKTVKAKAGKSMKKCKYGCK